LVGLRRSFFALAAILAACSGKDASPAAESVEAPPPSNPFAPANAVATKILVEIDYQRGAEPYTGSSVAFGDTWRLFRTNAAKLFEGTGKTIEIPTTLDGMEALSDVSGTQFSSDAVLAIAKQHRQSRTAGDVVAYYVVWLDGIYEEGGQARREVLGVSIGRTGVIAMFKPVIESAALPLVPDLARVVEQTTLVHEFGHAVGLVANGIPLASQHHDMPHGAHCTNDRCIMYYAIEGMEAARDYAQRNVTRSDIVLLGDECLADVVAARK
jgi:hypothetical protein